MTEGIAIIGPDHEAKSRVAALLGERLGLPHRKLGHEKEASFREHGFNDAYYEQLWLKEGFEACYHYAKPFEIAALEDSIRDRPVAIVELDEGQSVYEEETHFARAQKALAPYKHVILLTPSLDVNVAAAILDRQHYVLIDGVEILEHMVKHHSNHDLAKITVYSEGRTREQTRDEILRRLDPSQTDVILIGPAYTGKSTMGRMLAEHLQLPEVALDSLRWDYYKEIGFDPAEQDRIFAAEGFAGVYRYWKAFEIHAVERVLAEHHGVIHFGAGHSVFEDRAHFERAKTALAPYVNVVLLLPSPDPDESVVVLRERARQKVGGVDLARHVLTHHSTHDLATLVVATAGRPPEEVRDEIMRVIQ